MDEPTRGKWGRHFTKGTRLADRIEALGYSVNEVSAGTGIQRWAINDYLNRRRRMRTKTLLKFARFLECEPNTLRDNYDQYRVARPPARSS